MYLLLLQALNKIPQLGFGLALEQWRWDSMAETVSRSRYVSHWWKLRTFYQGIEPPTVRTERHFDPAAKFHIPDNTPYIRYFLSGILQMQIFEALCNATDPSRPLHECDIYDSKEAGSKLRKMMSVGNSKHWSYTLSDLTSGTQASYSSEPLLRYYAPLITWLKQKIRKNGIHVGW